MGAAAENPREHYLSSFDSFERSDAGAPSWLKGLRRSAIERFAALGFPTTREEDWKYTNVEPVLAAGFEPVWSHAANGVSAESVQGLSIGGKSAARLVFVDGAYVAGLSERGPLPPGVEVGSLAGVLAGGDSERIEGHLGRHAVLADGFAALATAFVRDGALVWIADGVTVDRPIELVFLSTAAGGLSQPRSLVVAGRGSRAVVVEGHAAAAGAHLANIVTEVSVGAGARLEHVKMIHPSPSAAHVATASVVVGRDGSYGSHSIAAGARFARNTLNVLLDGEGAECDLNGLYLTNDEEFVDNHTAIDHARPHGTSRELYKGILDGRSRAVFNGKVIVRQGSFKTDARQTNKNLLLSERAEIDTKPQLQIYADDVKCSHGAAIGALDPEALFYLKSRGLGDHAARRILLYGFASDVVGRISAEAVRGRIETVVRERLRGGGGG